MKHEQNTPIKRHPRVGKMVHHMEPYDRLENISEAMRTTGVGQCLSQTQLAVGLVYQVGRSSVPVREFQQFTEHLNAVLDADDSMVGESIREILTKNNPLKMDNENDE